ncbi:MAG: sporulation transcription factor Spo0A [Ruminococcus sp.]|nr:sporulation transcription factor Spo0A [Ruminococcus sp.]
MENDRIKVLIGDDTANFGIRLASALREKGLYAYTRRKDEKTLCAAIIKEHPDVVITDLTFEDSDALVLIKEVRSAGEKSAAFIIVSDVSNSFIERQVIENGAAYYMTAPVEPSALDKIIRGVAEKKVSKNCCNVELVVTDVIRRLGVPAHIKGYHYLRCAIINSINDFHMMDCVTKQLYPFVARQYDTTSSRVERAIRHAIEIAWDRGSVEEINNYFGCTSDKLRVRPTNSEFIALITDKLRLQLKNAEQS